MNDQSSGSRTMLMSVLMSAPGPLILGLGLLTGRSSTQVADFFRRTAELLALIMAYGIYRLTTRDDSCDESRRSQLERFSNAFVGAVMCVGGCIMILLSLTSEATDKGNVLPGLAIALLGVIANTLFWRKYTKLNQLQPNAIVAVQARLYRAKSLVDGCVTIALLSVALMPGSRISVWLDLLGSVIVAVYLIFCGVQTLVEVLKKSP